MPSHRIYAMKFADIYPLYVAKVERKQRTQAEVDQVIYMDKLVDELAKGKAMAKILRQ